MSSKFHRRLRRQLEQCFGDPEALPEAMHEFVALVDDAYQEAEIDLKLSGQSPTGLGALTLGIDTEAELEAPAPGAAVAVLDTPALTIPIEGLPDLVLLMDPEGVILDCQGGDANDLVLSRNSLIGKLVTGCPVGDLGSKFTDALVRVQQADKPISISYDLPRDSGVAQFQARLARSKSGNVIAAIRNTTEWAEAESVVRRSEQEYRGMIDAAHAAIMLIDPQTGKIVECNRRSGSFYLVRRDDLVGSSIRDRFEDPSLFPAADAISDGEPPTRVEARHRLHDGRMIVVEMFLSYVTFRGQRTILSVNREVELPTRRPVDRSLSMLKATFDATADGILVVDMRGNIVTSNRLFAEMWRVPRELLRPGKEKDAAALVLAQIKNPAALIQDLKAIHLSTDERSSKMIECLDGRYFECVSMPQLISGQAAGRVWSFRDVTDRMQSEERIRYHAYHDSLTALPNRTLFYDRLSQDLGQARRVQRSTALLLIDLDRFKTINDTLGHDAGDALLIEVAKRLKSRKRDGDTIARLGGDEFILLISLLRHEEDAAIVAEQILDVLKPPIQIAEHSLHISASIGIAMFPSDGESPATLMKSADVALYRAKELGRNNYQIYEPKLSQRAMERLVMEKDLRLAIHNREFILHYQPQYDLKTGKMTGVEALIRWVQDGSVVPPDKFIPIAEECGLVVPLGHWVLKESARQCAEFNKHSPEPMRVCVNLSALQIQRPNFANEVSQVMQDAGVPPHQLHLELTESALMQNPELGSYAMAQLEQMGIGLAMDDFGTGHSSLSHLSHLPISMIKIDKSFVTNCAKRKTDAAILEAIVTMGHALGMKVLAEGVETEEQATVLRDQGCDEVQGYFYSRPISAEKLIELIRGEASAKPKGS